MMVRHLGALFAAALAWLLALACGARTELEILGLPPPAPLVGGEGGQGGDPGEGGAPQPPDCVVFDSSAVLAPLDVILMVDTSGSMSAPTPGAGQKWWAVRNALESFFADADSAGVGVAISFFPIIDETVVETCLDDNECGVPDMCSQIKRCLPEGLNTCVLDADCKVAGSTCEPVGICENAPTAGVTYCYPTKGIGCAPSEGPCIAFGYCDNRFTCDAPAYATPVVPMATLPGASAPVLAAIEQQYKEGGTPTLPALQGAITQAVTRLAAEPDHKVIVLIATDGLPTACDPALDSADPTQAIVNLANVAGAGLAQGIETFVIGVFAYDETEYAKINLDNIAKAGGSESAFVVSNSTTTAQQILEALRKVRQALSCEFPFVIDGGGEPIDYSTVWVRITTDVGETWVERVDDIDGCHPTFGGFYYNLPPDQGTPTRITLCPQSCEVLEASKDRSIEIFTTCDDPMGG